MSTIQFSQSAVDKVASLMAEENNPNLKFRAYVTGGGCSGLQYGFTFDENIQPDDTVIEKKSSDGQYTVKLLVDPMSFSILHAAEIDFTQDIHGEQFIIRNPNVKSTCGCGSSFSLEDDE